MNKFKIVLGGMFLSIMAAFPAFAFDGATLSEIKISSKDNYSYKVVLKTDKDVPVQKYVTSDNKIVIDLNNARSAEFVNTIYNNSPEIDNVIVQPVSNNKVRVFIQGLNISQSKIILDSRTEALDLADEPVPTVPAVLPTANNTASSPAVETPQPAPSDVQQQAEPPTIDLSSANNSQPQEESLFADETASDNKIETVKDSMLATASMKKVFSKEGFDWLLRIFAVIFITIGAVKLFNKPKNITVDLTSADNLKTRELELYRAMNDRKELLSKSIGSTLPREKQSKKPAYGANSQYAMREYQNSQLPPQRLNRPENINPPRRPAAQIKPELKASRPAVETKKPAVSRTKISQPQLNSAKSKADNIKFLENMAAIYERSGRTDLARNIKQNIIRAKAAG